MSKLKKRRHLNVDIHKKISISTKCAMCESLKYLILKLGKNNIDAKEYELKLRKKKLH
jgi:hypothetical protein